MKLSNDSFLRMHPALKNCMTLPDFLPSVIIKSGPKPGPSGYGLIRPTHCGQSRDGEHNHVINSCDYDQQ